MSAKYPALELKQHKNVTYPQLNRNKTKLNRIVFVEM